jgi:hypothetical protein
MKKILALLILLSTLLSFTSCKNSGSITVYTHLDGKAKKIEIDLGEYNDNATFYDVLLQNDTLEADLDKTAEPRLLSVCNVHAGEGEAFMLLSSVSADAGADAHPSVYENMTFYAVENLFNVRLTAGASYLIVLIKEG